MSLFVKSLDDVDAPASPTRSRKATRLRQAQPVSMDYHEASPIRREDIVASECLEPEDLHHLLTSLAQEDCVHSWRNFDPEGSLDGLLAWENRLRPTRMFFFYLKGDGKQPLVAASVVADRLTRDFPHRGFPVLGRCYIMPEFRGRGLYRPVLHYRMEYCQDHYGSDLKAIHIGSTDDRISRVLRDHRLPGWPSFIHLGEENLCIAEEVRKVGAYMLLVPEYVRRIRKTLAGAHAPECVLKLRKAVSRVESGEARNLGILLQDAYEESCRLGWFDERDPSELEQLLSFCRSIPLVGLA